MAIQYVDASAVLRILFREPGPAVPLGEHHVVSSQIVGVEAFRAIDRERLLGHLDDLETSRKRKELSDVLTMIDLVAVDDEVIDGARGSFSVVLRALDAIHVTTARIVAREAHGEVLEFWTHDDRQGNAARSVGLNVLGVESGE
jgi:predicted nucleic acid-binding protein